MIDHVHLKVRDLRASRVFYDAAFGALGLPLTESGDDYFQADELFVSPGQPPTGGRHLAFQAADRAAVDRLHAAVLRAGAPTMAALANATITAVITAPSPSIPTATMPR
jgi:catechol 2,3-dioxygenase-like lactoylglutathione lyase family enzyme